MYEETDEEKDDKKDESYASIEPEEEDSKREQCYQGQVNTKIEEILEIKSANSL